MKHQFFTRSLFVALCAFFVCISAVAGELNPFAFKVSSEFKGDVFNVVYYLNAPATSVKVTITLPNKQTVVYDCTDSLNTLGSSRVKGIYDLDISLRKYINDIPDFRGKTDLPWSVDVMGGNPAAYPTEAERKNGVALNAIVAKEYAIYRPHSVDIDNDPYSDNFGMIYMLDAGRPENTDKRVYFGGSAADYADGLYVFDAAFQFMPAAKANYDFLNPMTSTTGTYSINARSDEDGVSAYDDTGNKHLFNKVRISHNEDHSTRLFVTYCSKTGPILSEGRTRTFSYYEGTSGWFKQIIASEGSSGKSRDASTYNLMSGSTFVAGPNIAFDVYDNGKAEDLELLMLSRKYTASNNRFDYRGDKYKLGDWTWGNVWYKAPTTTGVLNKNNTLDGDNTWYSNSSNGGTAAVGFVNSHTGVNVEYDQEGGFWLCFYRSNHSEMPSLVHFKKDGSVNFIEYWANRINASVRYDNDNNRLVVSGGKYTTKWTDDNRSKFSTTPTRQNGSKTEYGHPAATDDALTIYTVKQSNLATNLIDQNKETSPANRVKMFTDSVYINGLPANPNDIAWDYADNLYLALGGGAQFMAYALPHAGKTVSTPCKTNYYFNTPTQTLTVKVTPNLSCGDVVDNSCPDMQKNDLVDNVFKFYYLTDDADGDQTDATKVKYQLKATPKNGYRFVNWGRLGNNNVKDTHNDITSEYAVSYIPDRVANFGINVWETDPITPINEETTFRGVFVKRDLDTESYSTICLPFNLETLVGTPYVGASVLEFISANPSNVNGDNRISLNFTEVTFGAGQGMKAGVPYLIKVANEVSEEKMFWDVTCPDIDNQGKTVTKGDVTFHGLLNPTTFTKDQVKDKLFLTADNRLVSLYGKESFSINGLRGYFTVSGAAQNVEFVLNLPEKVTTSIPMVNIADSLKVTKYLWNGQIYIQRGNQVYDLSGVRVK